MATDKNKPAEMSFAEMQAQVAAMMEEARAEREKAAHMLEEAKRLTEGKVPSAERAARIAEDKAKGEELVEIKLFKDTGKYKDDVFVAVNGEAVAIKRGERVKIKRKFAEVLDNSEHQDYETSRLIEQKAGEFEKSDL